MVVLVIVDFEVLYGMGYVFDGDWSYVVLLGYIWEKNEFGVVV